MLFPRSRAGGCLATEAGALNVDFALFFELGGASYARSGAEGQQLSLPHEHNRFAGRPLKVERETRSLSPNWPAPSQEGSFFGPSIPPEGVTAALANVRQPGRSHAYEN
jgi:hypothetical protein